MLKMKQRIVTSLQNKPLTSQISDRSSLANKSPSIKNSSNDEISFPKCSSKLIYGRNTGILLKSKADQREVTNKKQYFQTENQMIEHNNNYLQNALKTSTLSSIESRNIFKGIKVNLIVKEFVYRLKRNFKSNDTRYLQKILFQIQGRRIETSKGKPFEQFCILLHFLWQLAILAQFIVFSLAVVFPNISQSKLLIVFRIMVTILFVIKQFCISKSTSKTFTFRKYFSLLSLEKISFFVNLLTLILLLVFDSSHLSLVNLFFCLFCFKSASICQEFLFEIIIYGKVFCFFQHLIIVKILTKMIILTHLVEIVLIKLCYSNQSKNWLAISLQQTSFQFVQTYIYCFTQAISIVFTFGFHMPSSANIIESLVFSSMKVIILVFSFINIKEFLINCLALYHNKENSYNDILQKVRITAENVSMEYNQYHRLVDVLKAKNYQFQLKHKINQKQISNLIFLLPQQDQSVLNSSRLKPRISFFSLQFPYLTKSTKVKLSQSLLLQQLCKDQVLQDFSHSYDFFILKQGKVAYSSINHSNPLLFQAHYSIKNQYLLLNNSFMKKDFPNYTVKSLTPAIIYRLKEQDFRNIISKSQLDFQSIWELRDSTKFLQSLFQTNRCKFCMYLHSQFLCPSIHFAPYKSAVINKYLATKKKHPENEYHFVEKRIPRLKSSALKLFSVTLAIQSTKNDYYDEKLYIDLIKNNSRQDLKLQLDSLAQSIATKIYAKIKYLQQQTDEIWALKTDVLYDYKYYFKHFNPENLKELMLQKKSDVL